MRAHDALVWPNGVNGHMDVVVEAEQAVRESATLRAYAPAGDRAGRQREPRDFLASVPLLRGLPEEILAAVAAALQPLDVAPGDAVCRAGEAADAFYLIERGTLAISICGADDATVVRRLGAGDAFGELALLARTARTASVFAETPARLFVLSRRPFLELLRHHVQLAQRIEQLAAERSAVACQPAYELERYDLRSLADRDGAITLGRDPGCTIAFTSRVISRRHAVVQRGRGGWLLCDSGSHNGTFLNGRRVAGASALRDGDEIWIGAERLLYGRDTLTRCIEPPGVRINLTGLRQQTKSGRTLLAGVSLSILPGELVAVIGGSGAGKSTLLDAMAGVRPASGGRVLYDGRDYYAEMDRFRSVLGYVPQDDIIHTSLPLRRVLQYAAGLRLPPDLSREQQVEAVREVIAQLDLAGREEVRVGALSGGQRKRASIGVELLTRPRVFFLDEPTSGLDPATESQIMALLRRLADEGSTVVLTTHATRNLPLCDRLIVLGERGTLAFCGSPEAALRHFGVQTFDDIYGRLPHGANTAEAEDFGPAGLLDRVRPARERASGSLAGSARGGRAARQLCVLLRRNLDTLVADRRELAMLLLQPLVIPLLMLAMFRVHPFALDVSNPRIPLIILYFLVSSGLLFGISNAIREIVKEDAIFRRERMANLGLVPYVLAKALALAPFLMLAEATMAGVLWLTGRMPDRGFDVYGPLLGLLWLNVLAAMALGLLVSALVRSSDQASRLVPILLVPQLLFSGAILSVPAMGAGGAWISRAMLSRWTLDAIGHVADLDGLFRHGSSPINAAMLRDYGTTFEASVALSCAVLACFIVGFLALTCLALRRRTA